MFEVRDKDLAGRIGRLKTPHGTLETPVLFPVVNPRRQEVPLEEIKRAGFQGIITNAYLIKKYYGREAVEKGVHGILGFDDVVMTDSGAYQILQYGRIEADPREIVEYEEAIGADIAVILDIPTGAASTREEAEYTVEETLRRARLSAKIFRPGERIWVLPIQGGIYLDLVERSAKEASRIEGYGMYAIGSPTPLMEHYEFDTLIEIIYVAKRNLPPSKPVHLFGAGHPMLIPITVAMGIDSFDSASYILYARDERYLTRTGTLRLKNLEYFPCSCPVCSKHTPQELREAPREERVRLLATHNLYVISSILRETKQAIREGRLWELAEEISHAHPSLYRAFQAFASKGEWLELHDPRAKGVVRGIFLYDELSLGRPELVRHRRFMETHYQPPPAETLILLPGDPRDKPYTRSRIYQEARKRWGEKPHYVFYTPFYGTVPEELAETYPYSQFEAPLNPPENVVNKLWEDVKRYLERYREHYSEAIFVYTDKLGWSLKLKKRVARAKTGIITRKVEVPASRGPAD